MSWKTEKMHSSDGVLHIYTHAELTLQFTLQGYIHRIVALLMSLGPFNNTLNDYVVFVYVEKTPSEEWIFSITFH